MDTSQIDEEAEDPLLLCAIPKSDLAAERRAISTRSTEYAHDITPLRVAYPHSKQRFHREVIFTAVLVGLTGNYSHTVKLIIHI